MALTFTFDAPRRLVLEPGYRQWFSSAQLALSAQPADDVSRKQVWADEAYGTIMLKPLQLQDDFLNHQAQLDNNVVFRVATDWVVNPADTAAFTIFEQSVGTSANPWTFHTPASPTAGGLPPVGPTPFYPLQIPAGESEMGSRTLWSASPGSARPAPTVVSGGADSTDLRLLVTSTGPVRTNQGLMFRWFHPNPALTPHQTIYAFAFGQYLLYCRNSLLEVYRDVSPGGDRSAWTKTHSANLFSTGSSRNVFNPAYAFGSASLWEPPGEDRSLLIIPYRRQHIYIQAGNTGKHLAISTLTQPQMLADGTDWDITRSDTVQVWALTGVSGRFQVQLVKYEPGPATLNFPSIITEYTPAINPTVNAEFDQFYDEGLIGTIQFPQLYTLATNPSVNDCPPATADGTGRTRTYGLTLSLSSTSGQQFTPQFYGLELAAAPVFMDNPATPTVISDSAPGHDAVVLSADISLGTQSGEGNMTAQIQDKGAYPLTPYYYRSEMPIDLTLNGTTLFSGYSDRMEVTPLRHFNAPRHLTVHGIDKWMLLETTYLRDQRDWQGTGHITVVDFIAQQAGIDTLAQPAEYPTGWDGARASVYNTPLGTPIQTADNLEGNQLLGWKPQVQDTAASYLKRIQQFYSGWTMGFRKDGTFYYLPYNYFTTSSVTFHHSHGLLTPIYRNPVEYRVIEPSGNVIECLTKYQIDLSSNHSALFIDWASILNPAAPNYLGRYKWFKVEVQGAFSCPQLNAMAYIVFQNARRRRQRVSFQGDFVPGLEIGHVFTLEGDTDYRLIQMRGAHIKGNWETANYVGEAVELGY